MTSRVTGNVFMDRLVDQMQMLQQRQNTYQIALATGKRIHVPSDDPAGYRRSLELQSDQRLEQQWRNNTSQVKSRTESYFAAATELQGIVSRAAELTVRADGTLSQNDRDVVATEVNSLLERAVSLGNRQMDGQFLFGGTSLQPTDNDGAVAYVPFRVTRKANGEIDELAPIPVEYRGNYITQKTEIETGSTVDSSIIGRRNAAGQSRALFMDNQLPTAVNVFQSLINLRTNLRNNTVNYTTTITDLRNNEDNIAVIIGTTSANLARFDATAETHTKKLQADEVTLSQVADTDVVDAAVSLKRTQNAFEAALQTGAQILNLSILNYL